MVLTGAVEDEMAARFISDSVFEPVFATNAARVASFIATPVGDVPVVTSVAADVPVTKLTMDAVPAVLFATMA
jgi:hypothetical protein